MDKNRFYLTKRYMTALTLIALLSIMAFINMSYLINQQAGDDEIINMSGQQIMLSQQIALYAIYYQTEQLKSAIEDMGENHRFLLSQKMSGEIRDIYFGESVALDAKVREFIENAEKFRLSTDGKSLTFVLRNSGKLLLNLNKAAKVYLKESEAKTAKLRNFEVIICLATLFTLFLEAIFIFMPANSAINRKTRELLEEKNYSNTVIESSANAIISIDKNLFIKTYNKKAQSLFGFTKDEMKYVGDLDRVIPKFYTALRKHGLAHFFVKIFPKLKEKSYELKLLNKNGDSSPCRVGVEIDKSSIIVINVENITKDKLKDTLLHKQAKFAALGEMIAIIAHQWRQPLSELGLNNMYLKKKIAQKELKDEINKNESIIRFMSETITNFEDFYKNSDKAWFDPKDAISQSLGIVEKILNLKGVKLILEIEKTSLLYERQNSLAQVILSILQNSIDKFESDKNAWIKITMREVGKVITLRIEDNAGGIQIEPIEAIFEPFHTGKKSSSTGLGLYMSKLVIEEKFGGNISASNTANGALLSLCLPCSTQSYIQADQRS